MLRSRSIREASTSEIVRLRLTAPRREASQTASLTNPRCHCPLRQFGLLVAVIAINARRRSKKSAGRRFACAAGYGLNEESVTSFNRASQRSESNCVTDKPEVSLPTSPLRTASGGDRNQCSETFEEIGWTPIRLRRWLRVKRRERYIV